MTVLKTDEFVTAIQEGFSTDEKKISKKEAKEILDTFAGVIENVVFEQQKGVRLGGLGTLKPVVVSERKHRVPSTGEEITKAEHYALKFAVNAGFKRDLAKVPTK